MTPQEIKIRIKDTLIKHKSRGLDTNDAIRELIYIIDSRFIDGRDKALEWASKNVKTIQVCENRKISLLVDTNSIIVGKTSEELQP